MNVPWKVLIVDDEMLIRQGIINYMNWESNGFQIVGGAANGTEALHLIEQVQPHIIITDVVMPGMDGIELVKKVKVKYPEIEIVVLSSFENFDYVRSTFQSGVADYILKPKLNEEELIKTLRKIVPNELEAHDINYSSTSVEETLKKRILGYPLLNSETSLTETFQYDQFCLVAIYWTEDTENVLTSKQITDHLQKYVEQIDCYLIPIDNVNGSIYILNFESTHLPVIKRGVTELAERYISSEYETDWIMSKPFTSILQMKKIYENNLLKMKDYFFYLSDKRVLIYDHLPTVTESGRNFELNQFIDFFRHKQFSVAIHYLNEHVDSILTDYTKEIFEFKSWLENILFNVLVLLGNMKYDTTELETKKYDYFTKINEAQHARIAINHFQDFLTEVKEIVLIDRDERPTNMERLLQYIEGHYSEPLSLTTLANHFHFNASYLSNYFSTNHKEGFSEYLNHVRINKAKLLLKSSSTKIAKISDMVGYSDPSYFCKVFKRMEGKSPRVYRKMSQY